jgi:large subunit ribosomal protein L18
MRTPKCKFEIRKNRIRARISKVSDRARLSVFRSGKHLYAQIIDDKYSITIISASTLDKEIRELKKSNCNIEAATKVGTLLAKRAGEKGVTQVVFDKSGYKYHGVIKAIADAARKELEF